MECEESVRITYSSSRELARYKLNLAGVQEVRWDSEQWIIILLWKRKQKLSISNRNFLYTTENYQQLRE
jgi:hypothetical protein